MKRTIILLPALLGVTLISLFTAFSSNPASLPSGYETSDDRAAREQEPYLFFGDPHVLLDGDTYYSYGTRSSGEGIKVYTSQDLKTWSGPAGARDGFALHNEDVYGESGFWAPEVYHINDTYYMFFSVERHMAIATSDNPLGPFTQEEHSVLADFEAIDHTLFIGEDGSKYIYFAKFRDGLEIWGAEMEDDISAIRLETRRKLMRPEQPWELAEEGWMEVNEGPEVFKHEGLYYMVFTANAYTSHHYGIGLAYAENPLGPWTKCEHNPILQKEDGLVGIGHSMLFKDKEGDLKMAYHAHFDEEHVHPRRAYINSVELKKLEGNDRYILEVQQPRIDLMRDTEE